MAQAEYYIKILDHDGSLLAVLDDWRSLDYTIKHNDIGNHTLTLNDNDPKAALFTLDRFVQVWRKAPGDTQFRLHYDGFHRTPQHQLTEGNHQLFTSYGRTINDVLRRRSIAYFSGTDYTKKTGPVDDVMKAYVRENCGALATTNADRLRNILTPIYVAGDESLGPIWSGQRSYKRVLEVLQELGSWSQYRFVVDRDVDEEFGPDPNAFVFRTYEKRQELRQEFANPPLVFSPELGNMMIVSYTTSRTEEVEAVVALGQGEGEDRIFLEQLGTFVAESPYNDIEYMEDARQEELTAGLEVAALTVLAENGPIESFEFEYVQQPNAIYGLKFDVSDFISARYRDVIVDYRITSATIRVADGKETIKLTFQKIPHTFNIAPGDLTIGLAASNDPLFDALKGLALRLQDLELREMFAGFSSGIAIPPITIPFDGAAAGLPAATTLAEAIAALSAGGAAVQIDTLASLAPDLWVLPPTVGAAGKVDIPLTNSTLRGIQFDPAVNTEAWISVPVYTASLGVAGLYASVRFLTKAVTLGLDSVGIHIYGVGTGPDTGGADFDLVLPGKGAFTITSAVGEWRAVDLSVQILNAADAASKVWTTVKLRIIRHGTFFDSLDQPAYLIGGSVYNR